MAAVISLFVSAACCMAASILMMLEGMTRSSVLMAGFALINAISAMDRLRLMRWERQELARLEEQRKRRRRMRELEEEELAILEKHVQSQLDIKVNHPTIPRPS